MQQPDANDNLRNAQAFSYALSLEYLQAEFYTCSATGVGIADDLRGGGPPSHGCQMAKIQDPVLKASFNNPYDAMRSTDFAGSKL